MTYDIAIITVTYNKQDFLPSLAAAIQASSLRICLVVVDNASTTFSAHDAISAAVPDARIILREKNYGFGQSCNRAMEEVDAKYFFFLNPDTRLEDPTILDQLFTFMEKNPRVGIVAPRIQFYSGEHQETVRRFPRWYMPLVQRTRIGKTVFGWRYADHFLMRDVKISVPRMVDWAQGSALFMDAALFRSMGGFDDRFWMYFEDIDLCRRSWEAYRPVYYHPNIVLSHAYGKGSDVSGFYLWRLITHRVFRAHLLSWLRYTIKWHPWTRRAKATMSLE